MSVYKEIPFSKLTVSSENMRKSLVEKSDDKVLKASIKKVGILENLIVDKPDEDGNYPVLGGGRRKRFYGELIEEGVFQSSDKLMCRIRQEGESAKELSLAENKARATHHPVDEYEVYADLQDEGVSLKDLAASFGESVKYVKQRLALGRVAPEIRNDCRAGAFDIDILEAFTLTDDIEKQLEVYNSYKNCPLRMSRRAIKKDITGEEYDKNSPLVKFVGLKQYKASGALYAQDLFEDNTHILEPEKLEKLFEERVSGVVAELQKSGYKWVEVNPKFQSWMIHESYMSTEMEPTKETKKLQKQADDLWKKLSEAEDKEDWDLASELEDQHEELQEKIEESMVPLKSELPLSGCVVSINNDGELVVYKGLVRSDEKAELNQLRRSNSPSNNKEASDSDPSEDQESVTLSEALRNDLRAVKLSLGKAALLKSPDLAVDLLHFEICFKAVRKLGWYESLSTASVNNTHMSDSQGEVIESRAQREMDDFLANCNTGWLREDTLEAFNAFRKLPKKAKNDLLVYCSAYSLHSVAFDQEEGSVLQLIFSEADFKKHEYWRPSTSNFFKRIPKDLFWKLAEEILGEAFICENKSMKRAQVSERLEWAIADTHKEWLPEGF